MMSMQWCCLVTVSECAMMGPDTEQSKSIGRAWIFIIRFGNIPGASPAARVLAADSLFCHAAGLCLMDNVWWQQQHQSR